MAYGRDMELKDKLQTLMARRALNGQKLARSSGVSDSEISRILQGKSRPGLDNAFRLARSVGVTLDYLADDSLDVEPPSPEDHLPSDERKVLSLAQKIGCAAGDDDSREHPVPRLRGRDEPPGRRQADHRGRQGNERHCARPSHRRAVAAAASTRPARFGIGLNEPIAMAEPCGIEQFRDSKLLALAT